MKYRGFQKKRHHEMVESFFPAAPLHTHINMAMSMVTLIAIVVGGNVYGRAANCFFKGEEASSANTSKGRCCFQGLALEELPVRLLANHPIRQ